MHDVVIIGGGLVGSSLAIALDGIGLKVALVESAAPRVDAQPSYDERNLVLARASLNALQALGVTEFYAGLTTPIQRIHVSRRGDFGAVRIAADELDLPELGAVIPARELGNALLQRLDRCADLQRHAPAQLVEIESVDDHVGLRLRTPDGEIELQTRLLVGADGTRSMVRSHFGINTSDTDYDQSAIVTTLTPSRPLDGTAYERFTESGPVALLPLTAGRAGLVLTVPGDEAERIAALDDDAFIAFVHERFGYRAGRLTRPGKRKPYPLMRSLADSLTAPRMVLIGNAAQTVHPLGAQGFNLGLRDALTLAECLADVAAQTGDAGADDVLADYVAQRTEDRAATTSFSDDLVHLMASDTLPLRGLRSLGFLALDRVPALKRRVALRGMGFRGRTPTKALSP
ncbi:MAG: 2-octaprenyl-6-methoxyphenyl hydroxylase [Dokdonella sp.]